MSGWKHSIWKILSASAALLLMLPNLALGEFGVCPPYSKTFGPDDPSDQILGFVAEINARPGGGTLVLAPGEYGELDATIISVVCIRRGTDDGLVWMDSGFSVQAGAMLTLKGIKAGGVHLLVGGVLFAEYSELVSLENHGSAFLRNTNLRGEHGGPFAASNSGVQFMVGGSLGGGYQTGLENSGYALLDRVRVTGSGGWSKYDGCDGIGIRNSGTVALVGSTVTDNGGCDSDYGSGCCGAGIRNVGGNVEIAQSIVARNLGDTDCSGTAPIVDLGYNVFEPDAGCTVTEPTSIEADPGPLGLIGLSRFLPELNSGSPAIDLIPLELCTPTDGLGRARTDGNNDGIVACDAGALEYGYAVVEATVRSRPYHWREVGTIDLSTTDLMTIYVFSTETFDATQIVHSTVEIEGFEQGAKGWSWTIDVGKDGLMDYQVTWYLSRQPLLPCGYQEHEFTAMTGDGMPVRGLLKFNAVGCTP